jgi:hypothetical protein
MHELGQQARPPGIARDVQPLRGPGAAGVAGEPERVQAGRRGCQQAALPTRGGLDLLCGIG